jgi:hypothetical protein
MSPLALRSAASPPLRLASALGLALLCAPVLRAEPPEPVDPVVPTAAATSLALALTPSAGPYSTFAALKVGEDLNFWTFDRTQLRSRPRTAAGAATLVLAGFGRSPLTQAALLKAGADSDVDCWTVVDPNVVRPFPEVVLMRVQDKTGVPRMTENALEVEVYNEMLLRAFQTTDEAFRSAVAGTLDLTRAIFKPKLLRGKVFRVEGQLRLLRRYDAPPALLEAWNMRDVYEGWIHNDKKFGKTPICVLITALPKGLEPGEDLDVPVEFAGYYYKLLSYRTDDKQKSWQECPLLMGHSLTAELSTEEEKPEHPFASLPPIFLGSLTAVVGVVVLLSWWFRRSDGAVQKRLNAARATAFAPPEPASATTPEEAEPWALD